MYTAVYVRDFRASVPLRNRSIWIPVRVRWTRRAERLAEAWCCGRRRGRLQTIGRCPTCVSRTRTRTRTRGCASWTWRWRPRRQNSIRRTRWPAVEWFCLLTQHNYYCKRLGKREKITLGRKKRIFREHNPRNMRRSVPTCFQLSTIREDTAAVRDHSDYLLLSIR